MREFGKYSLLPAIKYLTQAYKKWLNFEGKIQTEAGIQYNCNNKLYEIVKEGKDYYNE